MIVDCSENYSILCDYVAELRDVTIQNDPLRFRKNLSRIGSVMAYEVSKSLSHQNKDVQTPLGVAPSKLLQKQPVIASILRAGLTMHNGMLETFDRADNAFISAFRKPHGEGDKIEVEVEYVASPSIDNKVLILTDPMLATGSSAVLAYEALLTRGIPSKVIVVCAIASKAGVETVKKYLPDGTDIWCAAIDDTLDQNSYIIPGLGDAGDLAYGTKI
ncbi:MAG: uracil phosphoribosyltransferase [Granulosicoccus sp.]|jgi:uracil phosphoribosyltransferase